MRIVACPLLVLAFLTATTASAQAPTSDAGSLTDQAREAISLGDRPTAVKLAEQACDAGEGAGCHLRGLIEAEHAARAGFMDRGCARGDGSSCFMLQMAVFSGLGVKKDQNRAKQLSQRSLVLSDSACAAGDPYSCMTAGGIYGMENKVASFMGGVGRYDRAKAQAAYSKGLAGIQLRCDAGSSYDCFAFATAVTMGLGIEADPVGGAALLQASCDGGFANACSVLGMTLAQGSGALAKDTERARTLLERGCEGGEWGACQMKSTLFAAPSGGTMADLANSRASQGTSGGAPAAASKPRFRILRSVAGAASTYMAAKAIGASPEEALGAAAKATEMLNPDSEFAKKLGQAGGEMLERGVEARLAAATAPASPGSAATASGASGGGAPKFTPKQLFPGLEAACNRIGVRRDDWERTALAPGGDVQLKTMCGTAYNYFKMYENAVRKGYSEADCNRTYAAHAGSARVALDYAKRG